eukprot:COSAG02_NODE_785_length_17228_cov_24.082141_8_plen_139_part_00
MAEEEGEPEFEQSFASVLEEGQGVEAALEALDSELQEGNWKTRLKKEEVDARRAVLEQAREVLRSAVKAKDRVGELAPSASAKKKQAGEGEAEVEIRRTTSRRHEAGVEIRRKIDEDEDQEDDEEVQGDGHRQLARAA